MDKLPNGTDSSHLLLTGTLLMAGNTSDDLSDYVLKTLIGGGIWLLYKLAADYINRINRKD